MSSELKIIATSDLHTYLPVIPPCDLLLIGGDFLPDYIGFEDRIKRQVSWVENKFIPWLENSPAKEIVFIAGNHDYLLAQREWLDLINNLPPNCHYLLDEMVEVCGLKIFGTPWTPTFGSWQFMKPDNALGYLWSELLLEPVDILLSHGPAYGILDRVGMRLTGSMTQHDLIKDLNPALQICGHIHEAQGEAQFKDTKFLNVSLVDEGYEPTNLLCEISWPSLEVNWVQTTVENTLKR